MKIILNLFTLITLSFLGCTKAVAVEEGTEDQNFHKHIVGASANHLLSDEKYNRLHIEVQ